MRRGGGLARGRGTIGRLMRESGAVRSTTTVGLPQLATLLISRWNGARCAFQWRGVPGSCIGRSDPARREDSVFIDARYPVAHPNAAERYSVHFCKSDGPARVLDLSG